MTMGGCQTGRRRKKSGIQGPFLTQLKPNPGNEAAEATGISANRSRITSVFKRPPHFASPGCFPPTFGLAILLDYPVQQLLLVSARSLSIPICTI